MGAALVGIAIAIASLVEESAEAALSVDDMNTSLAGTKQLLSDMSEAEAEALKVPRHYKDSKKTHRV